MDSTNMPTTNRVLQGHKKTITSIDFHPQPSLLSSSRKLDASLSKQQLASSSLDGQVILWNYNSNEKEARLYRFKGHSGPVQKVKYSLSGNLLASVSVDQTCRLWSPKANGDSMVLRGHQGAVNDVDFGISANCNESLLLTCSNDKTLRVWNLSGEQPSFGTSLVGHTNWVTACSFNPEIRNMAASGSDDGTVRIWDIATASNLFSYTTKDATSISAITFDPSGNLIAASLKNGTADIYDLRSDELVHTFDKAYYSGGFAFHANGNHILMNHISFGHDADAEGFDVYDIRTRESILTVTHSEIPKEAHTSQPHHNCCSFSSDGSQFATAGRGPNLLIWDYDVGTGQEINIEGKTPDISFQHHTHGPRKGDESNRSTRTKRGHTAIAEAIEEKKEAHVEDENGDDQPSGPFEENEQNSPLLANTLDNIMHLIQSLTQTVVLLEKRMSAQEHELKRLVETAGK